MEKGKVKRIIQEKEYGFIEMEGEEELLFHKQCLWNIDFQDLQQGQKVEFEVVNAYHGRLAFHVRPSED